MRWIVLALMLTAPFIVGERLGWWSASASTDGDPYRGVYDEKAIEKSRHLIRFGGSVRFIEPLTTENNSVWRQYIADIRANQCGRWQEVVKFVEFHFRHLTPEHIRASQLAEEESTIGDGLVWLAMQQEVKMGMSPLCLAVLVDSVNGELQQFVLLAPEGDLIFSYEDNDETPVSPLSKLDRRQAWYAYDALGIGDFVNIDQYDQASFAYVGIAPFVPVIDYQIKETEFPDIVFKLSEQVSVVPTPRPNPGQ